MSTELVIRAWKDEAFRNSLSESERAALPASPVGVVELTEAELAGVLGGQKLASPNHLAGTSWKPMCKPSACWKCNSKIVSR